jgi:hypothetical protein
MKSASRDLAFIHCILLILQRGKIKCLQYIPILCVYRGLPLIDFCTLIDLIKIHKKERFKAAIGRLVPPTLSTSVLRLISSHFISFLSQERPRQQSILSVNLHPCPCPGVTDILGLCATIAVHCLRLFTQSRLGNPDYLYPLFTALIPLPVKCIAAGDKYSENSSVSSTGTGNVSYHVSGTMEQQRTLLPQGLIL